jgi:hypothetical protein
MLPAVVPKPFHGFLEPPRDRFLLKAWPTNFQTIKEKRHFDQIPFKKVRGKLSQVGYRDL